jgi:CTP synthase (UTP-ammonia lyase)
VSEPVHIAILGDYDPDSPTLPSIEKSIRHASEWLHIGARASWLATPSLLDADADFKLAAFDAIWAAPGSPYKSFDGMLRGIEFARTRDWPFLGTCGGFQYALIECARNVLGIKDADSAENNSGSKNLIIYPVACAVPDRSGDAPKLSGTVPEIRLRPGSLLHEIYEKDVVAERFFCNFEVNPEFEGALMETEFQVAARGPQNEIRAVELPRHRFFIASLFQPQLSSEPGKPHPVIVAFLQAAVKWKAIKSEDRVLE